MLRKTTLFATSFMFFLLSATALAYNHPELKWRTIETPHFSVQFHRGEERTVGMAAEIAEEVYDPITSLYDYQPKGKIQILVKDYEDLSNGGAYYYDDKIEVWATNLDFELRGTHTWLDNVVTHEFTHIISLGTTFKFTRRVPALYFQYLGHEKEKRPDVLSGYPNVLISYPFPGSVIPMWFAEGTAQFQAPGLGYESWDTHRDMVLRMATLEDNLLTFSEMGVFGQNTLKAEMTYNQGFSLVRYISERYGSEALEKLMRAMGKPWRINFGSALKKTIHLSGGKLYQEWRDHLRQHYSAETAGIRDSLVQGEKLTKGGFLNLYPTWSPDGKKLAYLSNKGKDYYQLTLYTMDIAKKEPEAITDGISSSFSWSPDGSKIAYSKRRKSNRYGSRLWDIYIYDLKSKKEKRITHRLRARDPAWSPDGQSLCFIVNRDGTNNLAIANSDGSGIRFLTHNQDFTQLYRPQFSPQGHRILFGLFRGESSQGENRDVAIISTDGSGFKYLVRSSFDDRDPCWTPDGRGIIFSSDRTGIFNLYHLSLDTDNLSQLTNLLGGSFLPSISPDGKSIAYSFYDSQGYSIYLLPRKAGKKVSREFASVVEKNHRQFSLNSSPPSHPYRLTFSQMFLYPRLAIDDKKLKLGFYLGSNEILDKQSLFFGGLLSRDFDYDLYGIYENNQLFPTLFVEVFSLRRHTRDKAWGQLRDNGYLKETFFDLNLRYDLLEADVGARFDFCNPFSPFYQKQLTLSFSYSKYGMGLKIYDDSTRQFYGKDSWTYYRGKDLSLSYYYKNIAPAADAQINPRIGREIFLRYDRMWNRLSSGEWENVEGILVPVYNRNYYDQFLLDWVEHKPLPWGRHSLSLRLKGGMIDKQVDDFFYFQLGSEEGLRGYTYYYIEGMDMFLGSLTYRFPLSKWINRQLGQIFLSRLYGSLFAEYGKTWHASKNSQISRGRDVGAELRLEGFSFYSYPTRISLQAAYGMDNPTVKERWRFYLNVLFQFNTLHKKP